MLTCLSYKYFLWGADGPFANSIVHTESDLIALVFTQICNGENEWNMKTWKNTPLVLKKNILASTHCDLLQILQSG